MEDNEKEEAVEIDTDLYEYLSIWTMSAGKTTLMSS
jgi:hypothetical protein